MKHGSDLELSPVHVRIHRFQLAGLDSNVLGNDPIVFALLDGMGAAHDGRLSRYEFRYRLRFRRLNLGNDLL